MTVTEATRYLADHSIDADVTIGIGGLTEINPGVLIDDIPPVDSEQVSYELIYDHAGLDN